MYMDGIHNTMIQLLYFNNNRLMQELICSKFSSKSVDILS